MVSERLNKITHFKGFFTEIDKNASFPCSEGCSPGLPPKQQQKKNAKFEPGFDARALYKEGKNFHFFSLWAENWNFVKYNLEEWTER